MISRYFIALIPPEPVRGEITAFKKYCQEKYHTKGALSSPPHLTLHMPFDLPEKKIDLLYETLQEVAKGRESFSISLRHFSGFAPRAVFVNVVNNRALTALQREVVKRCRENLHLQNADYQDQGFHPHLTIAFRDLKKEFFEKAHRDFQNQCYERTFTADKISLLRHNGKVWEEIKEFEWVHPKI